MRRLRVLVLVLAGLLVGCATPRATFHQGMITASPGVKATQTIEGDKCVQTIDASGQNIQARLEMVISRLIDTLAGMVGRASAAVGD